MPVEKKGFVGKISLYDVVPIENVQLEDFERYAMKRIRILRAVEDALSSRKRNARESVKNVFNSEFRDVAAAEVDMVDVHSHYALRLAFCQTKEQREWLIRNECELLVMRYSDLDTPLKNRFLLAQNLQFPQISQAEFRSLKEKLSAVFVSRCEMDNARRVNGDSYTVFYKVPFERVPDLISQRKVFVHKVKRIPVEDTEVVMFFAQGIAYVPRDDAYAVLRDQLHSQLTKAMIETEHIWNTKLVMEEEDRLVPIIKSLKFCATQTRFIGKLDSEAGVADLEDLANSHFPLCMKNLYDKVQKEHHLKHNGRLQLQLFLKGIGLPYQDAYAFFKRAFEPKTGSHRFEKEYAYNIRHNYGLEGGRVDYTPYSCSRIISTVSRPGEHAGCPFKTFSESDLKAMLLQKGIPQQQLEEILFNVGPKQMHYLHACRLTLEASAGRPCPSSIEHPNQYYKESQKAAKQTRN